MDSVMHRTTCAGFIPSIVWSGTTVVMVVAFVVAGGGADWAGVSDSFIDCNLVDEMPYLFGLSFIRIFAHC